MNLLLLFITMDHSVFPDVADFRRIAIVVNFLIAKDEFLSQKQQSRNILYVLAVDAGFYLSYNIFHEVLY